jgi:hypothetical protein
MIVSAAYYDLEMGSILFSHSYHCEMTVEPVALALDGSIDFNTVVTNLKLLV